MPYKKEILVGGAVGLVIIAGAFGWQYFARPPAEPAVVAEAPYQVPPPGEEYTNETYRFSVVLPQGFSAREMDNVVVIEDSGGRGVQIVITPLEEDIPNLTAERIAADVPDLAVRSPETVEIGEGRTGLAFLSDNEAFDGASREVWFVFDMKLFQISTYERLDALAKQLFSTWEFF